MFGFACFFLVFYCLNVVILKTDFFNVNLVDNLVKEISVYQPNGSLSPN